MTFGILGMGTAVPASAVAQREAEAIARALCCRTEEHATWLPGVYEQSGIRTRYLAFEPEVVADVVNGTRHTGSIFLPSSGADDRGPTTGQRMQHYREHAGPLARKAAAQALDRSGVRARDITHLVTVSCTGFSAPGADVELMRGLGLAATTERTHLGFMGCHGALNGLRVARALCAEPKARLLVCAVELCSVHYHYGWDAQKLVANALFSDGAAAVVGAAVGDAETTWKVKANGSCLIPDSADAMSWTVGDHGFEMTLSRAVPALIARHLRPWLERWLATSGLSVEAIRSWAVHPGGPRIVAAVEEALDLGRDATAVSRDVLAEYGNMSSPTLLFILERLRQENGPRPCVALGFGPGLHAEAALFQ
jgi:predicted naringenin-chalcone synthase